MARQINDRSVDDYTKMTLSEHILHRSSMYMGSKDIIPVRDYIATEDGVIKKRFITSQALLRIYLEILL